LCHEEDVIEKIKNAGRHSTELNEKPRKPAPRCDSIVEDCGYYANVSYSDTENEFEKRMLQSIFFSIFPEGDQKKDVDWVCDVHGEIERETKQPK
jgi:hypothetical protein